MHVRNVRSLALKYDVIYGQPINEQQRILHCRSSISIEQGLAHIIDVSGR
jgi:hypothetical protein